MGRRRAKGRNISGVLLLDKPLGLTSNAALQEVKRLFGAAKAGHTGSLDPLADGLLPLCFGEATKMSAFLLDADKRYHVRVQLGVRTTTGDAEGEVLERHEVGALEPDGQRAVAARVGLDERARPMLAEGRERRLGAGEEGRREQRHAEQQQVGGQGAEEPGGL